MQNVNLGTHVQPVSPPDGQDQWVCVFLCDVLIGNPPHTHTHTDAHTCAILCKLYSVRFPF